uniref:Uncharacterized protein n=1 Tax=Peronospora matthiolae TaxID=2874970 RepID=A0AAV1UJW2_9STRA
MNLVRCMLFGCGLPLSYWGYATEYAAYVLNKMPTRANPGRKSPLELLTKKPLQVSFSGKNEETKGYKVLIPGKQVVVTTRHVYQSETLTSDANKQLQQALESEAYDELEQLAGKREESRRREESKGERSGKRAVARTASNPTTTAPKQKQTRAERDKETKSKSKKNRQANASDHTDAEEKYQMRMMTIEKGFRAGLDV